MLPNALVLLLLASVLTYPMGGDAGRIAKSMLSKKKMTAWIAVCILYDHKYTTINPYTSIPEAFQIYLKVLVKAAELRYRDLENTNVILSVTRIEEHKGEEILPVIEASPSGMPYVDSDKTILELTRMRERRPDYYSSCDVLLLITGHSVDTHLTNADRTWPGLPLQGRICESESVAFIHDNGKTFSGVNSFAQQLAFLLNAPLQTSAVYYKSLMSHPDESFLYNVHLKGRAGMRTLLEKNIEVPGNNFGCWRDVPHALLYPLPYNYLGITSSPCGFYSLRECAEPQQGLIINGQQVPAPPCKHTCCTEGGCQKVVNWPDGKPCGVSSVCVSGWCVNMAGGNVVQPQ
uniref:Putative secreted metalloprotease n=1 Tax=Ixodes ricinus TaxID=34613 RepID=A0A6B0V8E5_IXORI